MTFPTMTHTWKFSSVGLTNVIPLPKGGGPYTIGMDKASGAYTGQLFWSPNLDASPLDDSWKTLTDISTSDESGIVVVGSGSNDDVRAIMGSITVRPTPVVSGGISTPIAKCEISVVPANSLGAQNRQRHASGYGSNLIGGSAVVQDEYAALVLADMGVSVGSFFKMQDGVLSPLTDSGPQGATDMTDATGITVVGGPWEGSKAHFSANNMLYQGSSVVRTLAASEEESFECWVNFAGRPATLTDFMTSGPAAGAFALGAIDTNGTDIAFYMYAQQNASENPADPGAWVMSTAYVQGDRRRAVSDDFRIHECEIAGTSAACEPTWSIVGGTVVDGGTLTWRDCGSRTLFHRFRRDPASAANGEINRVQSTNFVAINEWHHVVGVRRTDRWDLYQDGVLEGSMILANQTGQFGTPARVNFGIDYSGGVNLQLGDGGGGSETLNGSVAYAAVYNKALTAAEILSHYDKGVELGL